MQLFYCPDITASSYLLAEEESRHCIRVLRMQRGDTVFITDGKGNMHECRITEDHPRHCSVEVVNTQRAGSRAPSRLHIAIAPTKHIERFEWFLEKATEIGIDEVTPVWCHHSERTHIKLPRLEKVMVAAMKQSLKCWLPLLNEPVELTDFLNQDFAGQKLIAYCGTGQEHFLKDLIDPAQDHLILVGPEGDFSPDEVNRAMEAGCIPVSLGKSRLRTETAGVVACAFINYSTESQ